MNSAESTHIRYVTTLKRFSWLPGQAIFALLLVTGCGMPWHSWNYSGKDGRPDHFERSKALLAQGKYEAAFQENEKALAGGRGAPEVALFNMGLISAHSLNPERDYPRALHSFTTLIKEFPQSPLAEQAKTWVEVLEERQRLVEERANLAEEKRILAREREILSQERERLKYTADKARQVDIDIEKRRRKTLAR